MVTFLALAHMVGATQVMGWGGVGVGWGGDGNVHCTCTHICTINGFLLPKIQHS